MKTDGGTAAAKRRAGERAATAVEDDFVVGLGTGSTAAYAIDAIGAAVADGLDVRGIPTSFQSRQRALEAGIALTSLDAVDRVDLAIDGADQVVDDPGADAHGALIKGGGGAHAREKLVDATAERFVVVVDPSKLTARFDRSVPVEVLPDAYTVVADRVRDLEGEPTLRSAKHKDGPVVTDNGNLVLDCEFDPIDDPGHLAATLSGIPGVVEHGLFVDLADTIYVGLEDGVDVREY
ncbi:ribose-5-phosphate isomerase RpiA [Salinadaptatus halalkaliphilus]|uniref:Ribose-5-phosphate isomerase A n=1 Tax=Salinadaptatus halalkaliphilus TaxID=2419781 RepID=A0A4S3TSC9_9EURY|nr:ribose-5-phosphate isomerase RpiA [Salinadaptatus halalkaliphilus]THE66610.1 ribose-5-phosphate isomerase RpiA [Salinadaptatus halalkaliphilus]